MAKAELVDKLDIVCQYIRNCDKPFGGIQVVFVGDFMQLPPVFKGFEEQEFAFESQAWRDAKIITVHLTEIVRQHSEPHFAKFLNDIRLGNPCDYALLDSCVDRVFPDDGIQPVKLFCKNLDVDFFNKKELSKIKSQSKTYYAIDSGSEAWKKFFDKNCQSPAALELKIGAQVILLKNLDIEMGLVNGSVGIVNKLYEDTVEVKFITGVFTIEPFDWEIKQNELNPLTNEMQKKVVAKRRQLPLRLAWALTVHKAQGATLDRADIDVGEAFACGQVYVSLSRVRTLGSLRVKKFNPDRIMVNEKCMNFYKKREQEIAEQDEWYESEKKEEPSYEI
jgi:ATP-dependent DNA helicase PIF1